MSNGGQSIPGRPQRLSAPGLPAEHRQRNDRVQVRLESLGDGHQLLPGLGNLAFLHGLPPRGGHPGPGSRLLDGEALVLAGAPDHVAEELTPEPAPGDGARGTEREAANKLLIYSLLLKGHPVKQGGPRFALLL